MKLSQFYEKLDNPIYDDETLEKIVDIYSESSNFMEDVLKINSESDCSVLNKKDRDKFYLRIYDLWSFGIQSFLNNIDNLSPKNKDRFNKLRLYINENKPTCADDVLRFFDTSKITDKDLKFILDRFNFNFTDVYGFSHFDCEAITCEFRKPVIPIYKLYVNLNSEAKYLFFNNYVNECSKRLKRYYFKFNPESKSDDSCIIYADDDNLLDIINMINIVLNKNKSLLGNINKPPVICSKITDCIGYGSEVDYKICNDSLSYDSIRCDILSKSIDKTTREWIINNLNTEVSCNKRIMAYKKHFMALLYFSKVHNIEKNLQANNNSNLFDFSVLEDINSKNFKELFVEMYGNHYKEIVDAIGSNKPFSVDININGNIININNDDIDFVVKGQASILYKFDDSYKTRLRENIFNICDSFYVDPDTFSCNDDTLSNFIEQDSLNKTMTKKAPLPNSGNGTNK